MSGSGQVTTVTPAMQQAAKNAEATGQSIAGDFSRLLNSLEAFQGHFKGRAAVAFEQAKQNAHGDLMKIVNALNMLSASVSKSGVKFSTTDDQSEQEITKVAQQQHVSNSVLNILQG